MCIVLCVVVGADARLEPNLTYKLVWLFALFTVNGERLCEDFSSNDPAAPMLLGQHIRSDSPQMCGTAGSQVEHQRSVNAEQLYDHTLFNTMLLYHGS